MFYVDTASCPGMSGGLVIRREWLPYAEIEHHNDILGGRAIPGHGFAAKKIVGIYSGRIGDGDGEKLQLGIVWRQSVIDEIIEARRRGLDTAVGTS